MFIVTYSVTPLTRSLILTIVNLKHRETTHLNVRLYESLVSQGHFSFLIVPLFKLV